MADFDVRYTFFYDETNNIKKLHLNKGDFNVAFSSNFVLGGLTFQGDRPDVSSIFEGLSLQGNTKEVKLKHLAFGDFLECLTSRKLTPFLEYLVNSPLYMHFSSLNLLYYSIVDIVDSAIAGAGDSVKITPQTIRRLKNDLYKLCRLEIDKVVPLFVKYGYPDIKQIELVNFVSELMDLFKQYADDDEYKMGLIMLQGLFTEALANDSLPFIVDETSLILINGLVHFYMRPIYTFLNSEHLFDNETEIEAAFAEYEIIYKGKTITNYSFLDSKDDVLTQASDIIVGFVGKLSKFFNTHNAIQIEQKLTSMTPLQAKNLDLYLDLVLKSDRLNPGFFHYADSDDDHSKNQLLFQLRRKL
jgi:hypothetical protein